MPLLDSVATAIQASLAGSGQPVTRPAALQAAHGVLRVAAKVVRVAVLKK